MSFVTPCRRPENDPDDWFLGRDGKQYSDDPVMTVQEITDVRLQYDNEQEADLAVEEAEAFRLREAVKRRKAARSLCHTDCILRLQCLEAGLEVSHGTWGGYYEEERAQIVRLRNERAFRRRIGRVEVPAEE